LTYNPNETITTITALINLVKLQQFSTARLQYIQKLGKYSTVAIFIKIGQYLCLKKKIIGQN